LKQAIREKDMWGLGEMRGLAIHDSAKLGEILCFFLDQIGPFLPYNFRSILPFAGK